MNHESHITLLLLQYLIFMGSSTFNKPSDKRGSHTKHQNGTEIGVCKR